MVELADPVALVELVSLAGLVELVSLEVELEAEPVLLVELLEFPDTTGAD